MIESRMVRFAMISICMLGFSVNLHAAQPLPTGPQALLEAARRGNSEAVGRLIATKSDVNVRDARGRTPLLIATQGNHVDVARRLIAAGADVNAKDELQDSPFLYAGAEGKVEILKMTLTAGADNLLDTYPRQIPTNLNTTGAAPFSSFSPFGFNGRRVYAKLALAW
jgi:ankyrin repeat protein